MPRWPDGGYGVPAPYIEALRRSGARGLIVRPGETGDPEEILEPFDGLLLVGGGDVDPPRYGGDADTEHIYGVEPDRDAVRDRAAARRRPPAPPTLCICRGMQVMNIAFGGTLHQHLPDMAGLLPHGVPIEDTESMHDVTPAPGSRLLGHGGVGVPLVLVPPPPRRRSRRRRPASRRAEPDGLVEAIERGRWTTRTRDDWMLGVQWHPEDTAADDPAQQAMFDGFCLLAKWHGSRAKPGETHGRNRAIRPGRTTTTPGRHGSSEEAERLHELLGDLALRVDHVGSTSVPGLAAKPVIDIQVSVAAIVPRAPIVDPLVAAGYRHSIDPIETEHEFLSKGYDDGYPRRVHVHVCQVGSAWERRHLAFRDALRDNAVTAAEYAALKRRLAAEHPGDIQTYTDGKTAFIRSVEERALADT